MHCFLVVKWWGTKNRGMRGYGMKKISAGRVRVYTVPNYSDKDSIIVVYHLYLESTVFRMTI